MTFYKSIYLINRAWVCTISIRFQVDLPGMVSISWTGVLFPSPFQNSSLTHLIGRKTSHSFLNIHFSVVLRVNTPCLTTPYLHPYPQPPCVMAWKLFSVCLRLGLPDTFQGLLYTSLEVALQYLLLNFQIKSIHHVIGILNRHMVKFSKHLFCLDHTVKARLFPQNSIPW